MDNVAYLDCAASAPPQANLLDEFLAINRHYYANPSSQHTLGRQARQLLEECRCRCAKKLGLEQTTLVFCGGASEANNLVLTSLLQPRHRLGTLYLGPGLHPSLQEPLQGLQHFGHRLRQLPLSPSGQVDLERSKRQLEKAGSSGELPLMVVINAVDSESGLVQPFQELATILQQLEQQFERKICLHIDAVQWLPRLALPAAPWQSLVISGHKLGAVRGVGLLLLKRTLQPIYSGGGQEGAYRPGSENLAAIVNLTRVIEGLPLNQQLLRKRHDYLLEGLATLPDCYQVLPRSRTVTAENFAAGLISLKHRQLPGEVLLRLLDQRQVIVGTGSACRNNKRPTRDVGGASGVALERIRISLAASSAQWQIDRLIVALQDIATMNF